MTSSPRARLVVVCTGLALAVGGMTPAAATERPGPEDVDADEIVQAESHREMDMMTREPAKDARLNLAGDWRGLVEREPSTRAVKKLDPASLAERADATDTLLVTGRLDAIETVGWRSVWVRHDEDRLLLVVEPGEATFPLVGPGQTLSIDTARVVPGSAETARLLRWTQISSDVLRRQDAILVSGDGQVQVERTVEMPLAEEASGTEP